MADLSNLHHYWKPRDSGGEGWDCPDCRNTSPTPYTALCPDRVSAALDAFQEERDRLQRERNGEVWLWQGDGEDDVESLTCPVLMTADQVRALTARVHENQRLHDLVRFSCGPIYEVTDEEYAARAGDWEAGGRLETYDEMRAEITRLREIARHVVVVVPYVTATLPHRHAEVVKTVKTEGRTDEWQTVHRGRAASSQVQLRTLLTEAQAALAGPEKNADGQKDDR